MATAWKPTGIGVLGRLGLGLAGAFIGGIVTRVSQLDLGLGPVLIRYEDLLFSFIGAIVLILGSRFLRSISTKKGS